MNWLLTRWCIWRHPKMWPIKGQVICATCFRSYAVDWTVPGITDPVAKRIATEQAERVEIERMYHR